MGYQRVTTEKTTERSLSDQRITKRAPETFRKMAERPSNHANREDHREMSDKVPKGHYNVTEVPPNQKTSPKI